MDLGTQLFLEFKDAARMGFWFRFVGSLLPWCFCWLRVDADRSVVCRGGRDLSVVPEAQTWIIQPGDGKHKEGRALAERCMHV